MRAKGDLNTHSAWKMEICTCEGWSAVYSLKHESPDGEHLLLWVKYCNVLNIIFITNDHMG